MVQIQSGASWDQVYKILDPLNITVAGGRDASVGAGGFLTGGVSALSPAIGWGCDNVLLYEMVLASGEVVNVSKDSNIWGGFMAYPEDDIPRQLAAYSNFMDKENFDPSADVVQWSKCHVSGMGKLVESTG
ncbi:hypothetical protein EYZ11_007733 [Aspergillus tanneri]|uniref:FAD linked oxidase N-terminal domain-containing protein n=1 Tax=Aspergillus tanneri TaxID=1220188 RepID=A0A4S3JCH7_9EURO|nr:hypothetical protein EYZ11_007733 [Aspergillus tanneri]